VAQADDDEVGVTAIYNDLRETFYENINEHRKVPANLLVKISQ
jgi:hypothetical protein